MKPLKIGACLTLDALAAHRDWLFGAGRDIELQDLIRPDLAVADWMAWAAEARAALQGHAGRVGLHAPFVGLDIDNGDAELRGLITARYVASVDACAAVGGDHLVLHSPYNAWYRNHALSRPGYARDKMDLVHAVLDPVMARAESAGVTLVLENIEDTDPATRRALAADFASGAVQLSVDTGHAQLAHREAGAPAVDAFITDAGDALAHVHIQDVDGYADRHWPPGRGEIPWIAVFEALSACRNDPRLLLELRDPAEIPEGFAYLRDLGLAA